MVFWATIGACDAGIIDGVYGTATSRNVKCYQAKRGLSQDGVVGPNTWGKLANDMIVTKCVGSPAQCEYRVGTSNPYAITIRYTANAPEQDNYIDCTLQIGVLSISLPGPRLYRQVRVSVPWFDGVTQA